MIKRYFIWFLILGVVIRIILAGISAWNYDVSIWYRFALDLKVGFGPYGHYNFSYPPGMAAFFGFTIVPLIKFIPIEKWGMIVPDLYGVRSWIIDPNITSPIFNYMFKLPLILGEMLFLYLLFIYIRERISEEKAKWAAILWYLNPLVIFAIAIHGQLDIYPILFLFLGVMLLYAESELLAGLMIGSAVSMKMYPIFLVLPFMAIILSAYQEEEMKIKLKKLFKFIIGLSLPLVLLVLYLLKNDKARELVFNRFQTIGFEGSLNLGFINYIPWLVPFIDKNSDLLGWFQVIGLIIGIIVITLVAALKYTKSTRLFKSFPFEVVSLLVILVVYFFSQRTNPNYLLWSFPFMLIIIAKRPALTVYYYLLSLAGSIFYLAINSFSSGILFLPLAEYFERFNISTSNIINNYLYLDMLSGLINRRMMFDAYLASALIFIFSVVIIFINLAKEFRSQKV